MSGFEPGDLVLYKRRGADSYELGVLKRVREDGSFAVFYSGGDTAAVTPSDCLFAFENAARSVVDAHARRTCRIVENEEEHACCSECGAEYLCMRQASYCPDCGARVMR